jgi:hypothetical protein
MNVLTISRCGGSAMFTVWSAPEKRQDVSAVNSGETSCRRIFRRTASKRRAYCARGLVLGGTVVRAEYSFRSVLGV